jgi:hypothetical protein
MVFGYDGLSVSGTSQAITGLSPGATYYYRVRADKTSVTGQGVYAAVQTVQLAVDYTITFVPPAGLAGMSNQTIAAGTTANLSANTMTNPGYTFAGWATTSDGAVVYSDGASYTMGAADVTLWSTWIVNNPTGVISGNATVCAGTPTQLSIALTGQGPWSGTLSDGTPFSGSETPLLLTVTPTANTTYTIATLSNATSEDLGGSAMVTINPLPTAVIEATTNDLATATIVTNSSVALCEGGSVNLAVQADNTSATLVPLDQDSGATLAVGLRKLKSGYTGSALRLRRSSDNQEQDFGFDGNNLNTAAISTWLNGSTGFCTTLYDQSGHGGDIRQSNSTAQPMYVESGINNKPMLHFTTTQSLVNQVNYPAPFSVIYGSRVTGQSERALAAQYNNWLLGYWGGYKDQAYFEGWITTHGNDSQSDNAYHIYAASGNGTTSTIYKNGNLLISNGEGVEGPNGIGFNTGENSDFDFTDLMVFGTELSSQNIQKYNNSIGQYYGSGTVALNTYQWSTGATTPSIAVSTAGDYTVTVTNNYGCSVTATTTVVNGSVSYYADADGDGYGAGVATLSCTAITGSVTNNSDCDDTDATKWQLATFYVDADADGYDNGTASVCSGVEAPAGYSATTSGTDCDDADALLTTNCEVGSVVNLTLFIEGYYTGSSTMNSVKLNQDGVSSATEVEDMTVELRDATTFALVDTATGTLNTDGTLSVTFRTAAAGSYYVAVKGVNMIETWSATPQTVGSSPLSYDFSSAATQAYGSNMREMETGVWAFYSGDINQDETVDNSDSDSLFSDIENSNFGVFVTDLNGDGTVDNSDTDVFYINVANSIYSNNPLR